LNKWRELYIEPSFDDERRLAKTIGGWLEELAYHQKDFQPIIPDSQGQITCNKLNYRVV